MQLPVTISISPKVRGRPAKSRTTLSREIKQEEGEDNYDVFLDQPKRIKRSSRFSTSYVEQDDDVTDHFDQVDDVINDFEQGDHHGQDLSDDDKDFREDINTGTVKPPCTTLFLCPA